MQIIQIYYLTYMVGIDEIELQQHLILVLVHCHEVGVDDEDETVDFDFYFIKQSIKHFQLLLMY